LDILLVLGITLIAAFLAGRFVQYLSLPSVTGYVLMGVVLGPSVLGIVSSGDIVALEPVNAFALGLIGLSIGGELRWRALVSKWQNFGLLFLGQSVATFIFVSSAIFLLSRNLMLAVILGVLALAPAPGTILGVIREFRTTGTFPREIMSLVVLDSVWCIVAFTVATTFLNFYHFEQLSGSGSALAHIFGQIGPAIALGIGLGAIGIVTIDYVSGARQRQVLVTAVIFLSVGIPRYVDLPYLLVTLIAGAVIVNLSPNFQRFLEALHAIDTPVLVFFLTLAGARLHLDVLPVVGLLGVAYVLARFAGKLVGARLADIGCHLLPARCSLINPTHRRLMGLALTPQAGVAVGLAILAEQQLPFGDGLLVTLVLGSVIVSQLIAPTLIVRALQGAGAIAEKEG